MFARFVGARLSEVRLRILNNYFNLTVLNLINSFIYLLIYPFVITSVGVVAYGSYVLANSISLYFYTIVEFGFETHATKEVAQHLNDVSAIARLFSDVFWCKVLLFIGCAVAYSAGLLYIKPQTPLLWLNIACFGNVFACVWLPIWYFHGQQILHVATIVQLSVKLLSIPLILLMVIPTQSIVTYAIIVVSANLLSALVLFYYVKRRLAMPIQPLRIHRLQILFTSVLPYFWSVAFNTIKQRTLEVFAGLSFGVTELAVYDLASKLFSLAALLLGNINGAIFPHLARNQNRGAVLKIIKVETLIATIIVVLYALLAEPFVRAVFKPELHGAGHLAVFLCLNLFTILIVGAFNYFAFIPNNLYRLIFQSQAIALVSFLALTGVFYIWFWDLYSLAAALVLSGLMEIAYCTYKFRHLPVGQS